MAEPGTFSIQESFGGNRPLFEVMDELIATGHEVVVDRDGMGALFLRAEDCERLLTGRGFGAVAMPMLELSGVTDGPLHELWSVLMFGKDGEDHRRLRQQVARFFTAAALEAHRGWIEELADGLAADLAATGEFDLWPDFALPLAGRTTCHLIGIPDTDAMPVTAWALDLVVAFGTLSPTTRAAAEHAAVEFCAYLDTLIEARRTDPAADIISAVVANPDSPLSYAEQRGLLANITFGGLDAIAKSITTGVQLLLEHDQWARLAADPSLAAGATEEILRFFPPTGAAIRLALEPFACRGVEVAAHQVVLPSLRAACRDPQLFAFPDTFDIARRPGKQFAFGAGEHFCLGSHLGKLVITIGLAALARRLPELSPVDGSNGVRWGGSPFYGIQVQPLRARA